MPLHDTLPAHLLRTDAVERTITMHMVDGAERHCNSAGVMHGACTVKLLCTDAEINQGVQP